jgi:PAS domain S-box-containing protein
MNQKRKESYNKKPGERAQEIISKNSWATKRIPSGDVTTLTEDLQLHQVEPEMQNKELRQSQLELEEARNRYADLYDFAPVGYFTISNEGVILEANLTGATMLGVKRGLLIGKPFYQFINRADQDIFYHHRRKLVETKDRQTCELRIAKKDGSQFHGQMVCAPMVDGAENLDGIRAVVTDITKRKEADTALKQSECLLKEAQRVAHIGHWELDPEIGTPVWSEEIFRIFGSDPGHGEPSFVDHETYVHPDDWPLLNDAVTAASAKGTPFNITFRLFRQNNEIRWVHAIGTTTTDEKGKVTKLFGTAQDITERRQGQEERDKLRSQLHEAQKMEAIGTLAGGIAHDFNNILSAIMGYTHLSLESAPKGSSLQTDLKQVLCATTRATELVKQILTFSRQTEKEVQPVQVELIVREGLKLLRASLPTTIEISRDIQSNSLVMADPSQIHQVLMNLCVNAGHAMEEKGGVLGVYLTDVDLDAEFAVRHPGMTPGPYVKLTVSDTGHGMDRSTMDRIFEPYFTTKAEGKGTGLGLSVVHGIVKSCGGTITVDSEPGKGTTFCVYLPANETEPLPEVDVEEVLPRGTERILFVDDEPTLATLGGKLLEDLGYRVATRTSSLEALEAFRALPDEFDLVITDMTMPSMTGDRLAVELRRIRPHVPVILCTGFSTKMTKLKALSIQGLLMKPLLKAELAKAIRKALDGNA